MRYLPGGVTIRIAHESRIDHHTIFNRETVELLTLDSPAILHKEIKFIHRSTSMYNNYAYYPHPDHARLLSDP
jgi:hypothetical protein